MIKPRDILIEFKDTEGSVEVSKFHDELSITTKDESDNRQESIMLNMADIDNLIEALQSIKEMTKEEL